MSRSATDSRDLVISRLLSAPTPALWRAWADPALLRTWWCPKPWQTEVLAFDFRAGGALHTVMHGPDGERSDNPGCFLEGYPATKNRHDLDADGGLSPRRFPLRDDGHHHLCR